MSNSLDATTTQTLVTTLTDGFDGYRLAADKVENQTLAAIFRDFAAQRDIFASRLISMAEHEGTDIEVDGSALASVHRTWMSLKDAVTGSDPSSLLETCITGEEHAASVYQDALGQPISEPLRKVIEPQFNEIVRAKATLQGQLVDN